LGAGDLIPIGTDDPVFCKLNAVMLALKTIDSAARPT